MPFIKSSENTKQSPKIIPLALAAYFVGQIAGGGLAIAQSEDSLPKISGSLGFEIQLDYNDKSDDPAAEHTQLFAKLDPEITVQFSPELSLFAHGVFEPQGDPGPREDRYFQDEGVFLEELILRYETDRYSIYGGKFAPNFGRAWDLAPGLYGSDTASDNYEFTERVGVGGSWTVSGDGFGKHSLSASTFFLDTSGLAHSFGQSRGTRGRVDGGASNTEDFSSFVVAVDGSNFKTLPKFAYHIGYSHQGEGRDGTAPEQGVVAGVNWSVGLPLDITFDPLFEYAHLSDAGGIQGVERDIVTVSGLFTWKNWNLALAYAGRDTKTGGATAVEDSRYQISAGYAFDFGLSLDIGWQVNEEDDSQTQTFGALAAYALAF